MKIYIKSAKEMSRGVFWVIDGELLAFPFMGDLLEGVAKSGNTYNHKKLWNEIKPRGCNKPYNYYPRGRVDISNKGKPIIYINPNIDDEFIPLIKSEFGLGLKNKPCNRITTQKLTTLKKRPNKSTAEEQLHEGCEIKRWKTAAEKLLFFIFHRISPSGKTSGVRGQSPRAAVRLPIVPRSRS